MGTYIIGANVFGVICFAIYIMIKNRKKGCSCGCDGCLKSVECC